jgi:hypothetical protein
LLDSAKLIVGDIQDNYIPTQKPSKPKKPKPDSTPLKKLSKVEAERLVAHSQNGNFQRKYGEFQKAFAVRDTDDNILFITARYQLDIQTKNGKTKKNVVPFYEDINGKYHARLPFENEIPMYGASLIKKNDTVVIVEGENKVLFCGFDFKYRVVSPIGGSKKFNLANVEPLKIAKNIIIIPDNDDYGIQASLEIYNKIKSINENIEIINPTDKEKAWDIADLENKENALEFINNQPRFTNSELNEYRKKYHLDDFIEIENVETDEPEFPTDFKSEPIIPEPKKNLIEENPYFSYLGWDDDFHYFMLRHQRIIMTIPKQGFTSSRLMSIAPLTYWVERNFTTEQGNIKLTSAQDHIQNESYKAGRFSYDKVRGSGVWIDGKHKIVNTGKSLFVDGQNVNYDSFKSQYVYVTSEKYFGKITGESATVKDGINLLKLFESQKWVNKQSLYGAMGWALFSNFGGCLKWRPHIFITGKIGSGKSWLLDNIIKPIVGDYAHYGSGSDTEPGIRRSIEKEPRPVVLDEMKIKTNKDMANINNIMNLIRNSSSDSSAKITMAGGSNGGVVSFNVRSPFCLSSDQIPFDTEDLQSRILICELETPTKEHRLQFEAKKSEVSSQLLALLDDKFESFRVRIFQRLEKILNDIYHLENDKDTLRSIKFFNTNRKRANWSPILAVIYNVISDEPMFDYENGVDGSKAIQWLIDNFENETENAGNDYGDEDAIIYTLLEHQVRIETEDFTVAEMLQRQHIDASFEKSLSMMGIKINRYNDLCIATNSERIKLILKNTTYKENYDSQLRRNELCKNANERARSVRFKEIGHRNCRLFDWGRFKEKFLGSDKDE